MTTVRRAGIADEPAILDLLIDLHRHNEAGWGHPYNLETLVARIQAGTRPGPQTRDHPMDQRRGIIGVIGPEGGRLIGSVGLFIEPFFWYTTAPDLVEIWMYVRPEERHPHHVRDLMAFGKTIHESIKAQPSMAADKYHPPFMLMTGFMWAPAKPDGRVEPLRRLWRKLSGAREIGVLFGRR